MRKLKIATSITNRSLSNDVDKYKFIKSIATQLAKTRKEIDRIFDIGVTEFEIFKTKNTSEYVEKRKIWHIRQYLIENLQFGEQNIEKLIKINSKFKKQEIRIKKIADKLHLTLKKEKGKEVIDDFNFNSSFSVFSADKKCNAKYNVKKGDPFYTDLNYLLFRENIENSFYNDNWNENLNPLLTFDFCYTMHCLIYHSDIHLNDILLINDVWIDLQVTYQFFLTLK